MILNKPDSEGGSAIEVADEVLASDLVQATRMTDSSPLWTERCATHLGNTSTDGVAYSIWQFHSVDSITMFNTAQQIVPKSLWL
jgi:hypothetical protein